MATVTYTDDEAARLTSEQFDAYMRGEDPLGKNKKKEPKAESAKSDESLLRRRTRQANEAFGEK